MVPQHVGLDRHLYCEVVWHVQNFHEAAQTVIGERQRRDGEDDEGTDPAVGTTYRMLDQHYYPKKRSAVD